MKTLDQLIQEHYTGIVSRWGERAADYAKHGNGKYAQIWAAKAATLYREVVEKQPAPALDF